MTDVIAGLDRRHPALAVIDIGTLQRIAGAHVFHDLAARTEIGISRGAAKAVSVGHEDLVTELQFDRLSTARHHPVDWRDVVQGFLQDSRAAIIRCRTCSNHLHIREMALRIKCCDRDVVASINHVARRCPFVVDQRFGFAKDLVGGDNQTKCAAARTRQRARGRVSRVGNCRIQKLGGFRVDDHIASGRGDITGDDPRLG